MSSRYKFSEEEIRTIEEVRRKNTNKRAEARLKALEIRAKGASLKETAAATGFRDRYISQLVLKYRKHGIEAISGNHYGGNHRNMSVEEEAEILAPFIEEAEKGKIIEVSLITKAYQEAVPHKIGNAQIYRVMHRHKWRCLMPRSRHPQKADDETIAATKKLIPH